ncbi:ATPase, T2SS/T4P/T4SS family [Arthrobacter sp. IK3]|uniref:ATPase, T2SS/T4P/T4SS family n=1 Tax=Arthrobacter sp. IK3 TaxID=3448169 RepID=UPI003EE380CC
MVKNRAAKEAARNLKAETGITYPRALDLVRAAGREFSYPALTIGITAGAPLTWQPRAAARLEISGGTGTGKSQLMASMASQAAAAGIEVHILDLDKHGAGYSNLENAHIAADVDAARASFRDLAGNPRPALVFFEGISTLVSGMDSVRLEMEAAAGSLADAGYPVIAVWQSGPAHWTDSARILLGRTALQQRTAFLDCLASDSAGPLEGHYRAAGSALTVLLQLTSAPVPAVPPAAARAPRLDDLNLPAAVRDFASVGPGLYVFAGLTGSGKSTSMAAVLSLIMEKYARRVTIIEDTLELLVSEGLSEVRRRVLHDGETAGRAILEAVREVRDIIVVGDARTPEDFQAAIKAAKAGHTVFLAMHMDSAAAVPFRILDDVMGHGWPISGADVAGTLKGVLFQKLLRAADAKHARIPAVEMLDVTRRASELIREDARDDLASLVRNGGEPGSIPLATSLSQLVLDGLIAEDTAEKAIDTPMEFRRALLAGRRHSAQSLTLGKDALGDHIRHSLGMQRNLIVVCPDSRRRREAMAAVAGLFPGTVKHIDALNAGAELADVLSDMKDVLREVSRRGEPYFALPSEVRPARRCIVLDVPEAPGDGEAAVEWQAGLSKLHRKASNAGVTLLLGLESEAQRNLLSDELILTAGYLDLDNSGASYRFSPSGEQIPFAPVWEPSAA